MFLTERTYDIDELLQNNMHTHSVNSLCSKPEMIFEDMVRKAEELNLKTLAVTDHSDPGSDIDVYANYLDLKERLSKIDTPVRVLIGSELSAYGIGKFKEEYRIDKELDYSSYSHVHYHLSTWEQPEDRSPRGYAAHMLAVLNSLFETDRADNIAHPFSPVKMDFFNPKEKSEVLRSITDNELGDILSKGEKAQCSWEIHSSTFLTFKDFSRRFFNIGKEAGVHFTFGTDAHKLDALDTRRYREEILRIIK